VVALYRTYDADGCLLYVGISKSVMVRLSQHSRTASWFEKVATVTLEWFDSRAKAERAEIETIERENPLHNISYKCQNAAEPSKVWADATLEKAFGVAANLALKVDIAEKKAAMMSLQLERLSVLYDRQRSDIDFWHSKALDKVRRA
jgi:predicted GIY-YIG superfamily endonuclease